jgi:hypothetical protein
MSEKEEPGYIEKAKNMAKAVSKHVAGGMQSVTFNEYTDRLSVCKSCEYQKDSKCTICGCFLKKKAWWRTEECPKDKWSKLK